MTTHEENEMPTPSHRTVIEILVVLLILAVMGVILLGYNAYLDSKFEFKQKSEPTINQPSFTKDFVDFKVENGKIYYKNSPMGDWILMEEESQKRFYPLKQRLQDLK